MVTLLIVSDAWFPKQLELISGRHTHWPVWRWTYRRKTLATKLLCAQAVAGCTHNLTHSDCDGLSDEEVWRVGIRWSRRLSVGNGRGKGSRGGGRQEESTERSCFDFSWRPNINNRLLPPSYTAATTLARIFLPFIHSTMVQFSLPRSTPDCSSELFEIAIKVLVSYFLYMYPVVPDIDHLSFPRFTVSVSGASPLCQVRFHIFGSCHS